MSYVELGVTVIQQFTASNGPIAVPLLPMLTYGPGYNVQTRVSHSTPESYDGGAKSVSYPNIGTGEYVDLGDQDSWGVNENVLPVSVSILNGRKRIDSSSNGYFASSNHHTGTKVAASTTISGFNNGTFNLGDVGKSVHVHTETSADQGPRTIASVNGTGSQITLSGANWTVAESCNLSVAPVGGKVTRFYSPGNLSNARVGDLLEIGPSYGSTYEITALGSGNYIDLAKSESPSGNTKSWRVTGEFDEVAISDTQNAKSVELVRGTDFTYDRDSIDIASGVVDTTSPSGPIISGDIKITYRALKTSLSTSIGKIERDGEIASKVGIENEFNPLGLALGKARENTTFTVNFIGADVSENVKSGVTDFRSGADLDYSSQLELAADEDVYVLNPLSQETAHNTQLNTHVTDVSDPNKQWNSVRIGIINTRLSVESTVEAESTYTTWDINGVSVVQNSNDAELYEKSGRIYSRGGGSFPNFDGSTSPLPVNAKTDLVKLSGGTAANSGFWGVSKTEKLPIKDSGATGETAPYRGYFASNGNKIRSGVFSLTASDNAGTVRLTAPAKGTFRFLEGVAIGAGISARAWMPTVRDGLICSVTAVDTVDYKYIDIDTVWQAAFAGSGLDSQLSTSGFDDIFNPGGLTTSRKTYTQATASTVSVSNKVTAAAGFFTGKEGMYLKLAGTSAGADDDYHQILSVNGAGDEATVASITTNDSGSVTVTIEALQLSGAAGKSEFASVVAADTGELKYAGRDFKLAGTKATGTKNLEGFPAGTFGQGDVGREILIYEASGIIEHLEITAFISDVSVTTNASANFSSNNAISLQISNQDYSAPEDVTVVEQVDVDTIVLNKNWAQKYAGNGLASVELASVQYGYGDVGRVVRILNGAYAGTAYTVFTARPEELVVKTLTAFGSNPGLGADSSSEDQNGFAIEFTSSPGNNSFSLDQRDGSGPLNESGKTYMVQRDFRSLTVTGETFITKGLAQNDVLRVSAPASMAGDYIVDSIPSETEVVFKTGSSIPLASIISVFDGGTLESVEYELVRPKSKDQQAQTVADYAGSFANRRLICMWPDLCVIPIDGNDVVVPGYYLATIVGAFISGFPPQKPMSKAAMTGVSSLKNSKVDGYFRRGHLNTMAGGGVMVVHMQDDTDVPHIRHQLSTDTSDLKFQEVSITKVVDYVTRIIKSEFDPYTGRYVIGTLLMSKLRTVAQGIVTFCENQLDAKAGPLVNDIEFTRLDVSKTVADEVEADFELEAGTPFNRLKVTVRS